MTNECIGRFIMTISVVFQSISIREEALVVRKCLNYLFLMLSCIGRYEVQNRGLWIVRIITERLVTFSLYRLFILR